MTESSLGRIRYRPDWRWIIASYSYLVLFHLLPTFLLGGIQGMSGRGGEIIAVVWLFFGMLLISIIIGYRSTGFTVLEPAIAGFLYSLTMSMGFDKILATNVVASKGLAILFWAMLSFLICVVGAWMGELIQDWGKVRQQKTAEQA